jgi:hypothetical protein|tara:strand:+ start:92 stop:625 length:534 start_codon:yes stop_codon:yes gene_type:complete
MALWGNNDAVVSIGTVSLDYSTRVVTGSGTTFGTAGNGVVGEVIRFGTRFDGTYFGDAVIVSVANTQSCTIASTEGLSGVAIAGTDFTVSQLPGASVSDSKYSEASYGTDDSYVYAVSEAGTEAVTSNEYKVAHGGWVGVTTYVDTEGNYRVKSEVLVAMSGITTGSERNQEFPPRP